MKVVKINREEGKPNTYVYYDVTLGKFRWFKAVFASNPETNDALKDTATGMLLALQAMRNEIVRYDNEDRLNPDAVKDQGRWAVCGKKINDYNADCTLLARHVIAEG